MEMAGPLFEPMGIDPTDMPTHKLMLALFSGGLLPIISLTFAHMLVVYSNKETTTELTEEQIDELSRKAGIMEREINTITPIITTETIEKLEKHLDVIQKEKFGEEEKIEEIVVEEHIEPTIEEIHEEHTEEIVVDNQNLDELKDQLSNDTNIKRLSYSKRDV
jgi:type II secretory pathway component PulJ